MSATSPALGRVAAATGALCVGLHLTSAVAPGAGSTLHAAFLLVMAAVCLPCVRALWRAPSPGVWLGTSLMYGGMLAVHLVLLAAEPAGSMHAGHMAAAGWAWDLAMRGGIGLAAVQVGIAAAVLLADGVRRPVAGGLQRR